VQEINRFQKVLVSILAHIDFLEDSIAQVKREVEQRLRPPL
jgi:predicted HicB family RNase H-like nuclease